MVTHPDASAGIPCARADKRAHADALSGWYVRYHPSADKVGFENRIIVGPYRLSPAGWSLMDYIRRSAADLGYPLRFPHISDVYGKHYEYSQLCDHDAMLLLPYSAHAYGVAEARWMNIPLLIPSERLYAEWIQKYHVRPPRAAAGQRARTRTMRGASSRRGRPTRCRFRLWALIADVLLSPLPSPLCSVRSACSACGDAGHVRAGESTRRVHAAR